MSEKKHLHTISELSAHPISRNIEWTHLIPALSSIGLLTSESNGNYDFTRNGHTIVFERSHGKVLDIAEVLKLRHFLRLSTQSDGGDASLHYVQIVAIDHHKAIIIHDPGTSDERIDKIHADLTKGRILHKTKQSPTFSDGNPTDSAGYFDSIIKSMMKSRRIVILSHGTGSSSAGEKLFAIVEHNYPKVMDKIVAIKKCDLEAMTMPEIIELGTELLHGSAERIA
jgi:hypothetical protein